MGSGKTTACIRYMNEHPEERYLYITPFLSEAERISNGCRSLHFIEPTHYDTADHRKLTHTYELLSAGANVTTTHSAFKDYTPEMISKIREQGYTLFIDESVEFLEKQEVAEGDVALLEDAGHIKREGADFQLADDRYRGTRLSDITRKLKSRDLLEIMDDRTGSIYFWKLTPDLLAAFKDVFILTYLFEGQSIHHFLEMYKLPYTFIGVRNLGDGQYAFADGTGDVPEYARRIKEMLHVYEGPMNSVGEKRSAMSISWFKDPRHKQDIEQLKLNISNFFTNVHREIPASGRLWGGFKDYKKLINGKGYVKAFTNFNLRATNDYRNCRCLAYVSNVYMNTSEECFYYSVGVDPHSEEYALSTMIQWIWRSAIRDGKEVYLYVPSSRMREMLYAWMDSLTEGGDVRA